MPCPSYSHDSFDMERMPAVAEWAARLVKHVGAKAILSCGHSGLVIAGAVSYISKVPVIAVRKAGEEKLGRASSNMASSTVSRVERWVFLDDTIATGTTFRHSVSAALRDELITHALPAAVLLYNERKEYLESNPYSTRERLKIHEIRGVGFVPDSKVATYGYLT